MFYPQISQPSVLCEFGGAKLAQMDKKNIVLIGYSGHALVAAEVLMQQGYSLYGYMDRSEVLKNPLNIPYLGFELNEDDLSKIKNIPCFPSIGDNEIRRKVFELLASNSFEQPNAISTKANISDFCSIGIGTLICQGACVNPFAKIGNAVIVNTGAIIEHECTIGDYSHIAPGAVLAGNVIVGKNSFIGANAVIKQGVSIGHNVVVGAGAVVLNDIPDNSMFVGNPAKKIR